MCYRSTRESLVPLKLLESLLLVTTSSVGEPYEAAAKTRQRGTCLLTITAGADLLHNVDIFS